MSVSLSAAALTAALKISPGGEKNLVFRLILHITGDILIM